MIARLARLLWAEIFTHPMLALTIGSLAGSFVISAFEEYERRRHIVHDTIADLNERSDEIEMRIAEARVEEMFADFDADRWGRGGEIASRIAR